ncbi:MAG: glycosyltransferase family 2 protein [Lachnospiraceae bacterium]|nr:glycosyltransferase family 2 protein [Lachnospiraceae bacterium]
MKVELLVSALNQDPKELAEKMHITSDAVIINQCDKDGQEEFLRQGRRIRCFSFAERGVGRSRNHALEKAEGDICLFADEDICYCEGYEQSVLEAFSAYPQADMLLFNVQAAPGRETYHTESPGRVHWYNCGRYPTYSFGLRRKVLEKSGVRFSLLFGGGAKYSNGEDSLFIRDILKKGYKIYRVPVDIGREMERPSTWFQGYNDKFFFDRGVLYAFLYGPLAGLMAWRFLLAHRSVLCQEKSVREAHVLMKRGIEEGRKEKRA